MENIQNAIVQNSIDANLFRKTERWTRYATGDDLDKELRQFNRRETDDEFEQRTNLTHHIAQSVINKAKNGFVKAYRSVGVESKITGKDEQNLSDVISEIEKDKSLRNILEDEFLTLNLTDPNAYILVNVEEFDHKTQKPPIKLQVLPSDSIRLSEYYRGELINLVFAEGTTYLEGEDVKEANRFIWINAKEIVQFEPISDNTVNKENHKELKEDSLYFYDDYHLYRIDRFENTLGEIPAMRVGYIKHLKDDYYVSIIDSAMPYFEKLLARNSENDLNIALNSFTKKYSYEQRCTATGCHNGKDVNGQNDCKACDGTGFAKMAHTSSMDIVLVPYPKNNENLIDLSKLSHIEKTDVETLNFQREEIERLKEECYETIFNSDVFSKVQVTQTATETNSKKDHVNDTLYQFMNGFARLYQFGVRIVAKYYGLSDYEVDFTFPNDFKIETLEEMIANHKQAIDNNAPSFVVNKLACDIAERSFGNKSIEMLKYKFEQELNPFSGESLESIKYKTSTNLVNKLDAFIYANLSSIINQLEKEDDEYYQWDRQRVIDYIQPMMGEFDTSAA